jgi:LCP family protein required for cell wall assembly
MTSDLPGLPGRHRTVYRAGRRRRFSRRRPSFGGADSAPRFSRRSGRRLHRAGSGRRWPRRLIMGIFSLVVVVILLAVAEFVYVYTKLGDIHHETVSALTPARSGEPLDLLLVGSDSRACDSASEAAAFGSKTTVTGQRSDTLIVARFLTNGHIEMLSIPRDLWVPIAGTGGSSKINSAFNNGPNQLVETIESDLHIPINHVVMVDFCGFSSMVSSLGGIYMDFPDPVTDRYTGLDVTHTGCQLVSGTEALQIVRSRHLYYYSGGHWNYDGMSDFSRIKRQQAFFHALLDRIHTVIPDVFRLNSFIGASVKSFAVDSGFSSTAMMSLGWHYHSLSESDLYVSTLPVSEAVIDGQDALLPIPADKAVVSAFLSGNVRTFTTAEDLLHYSSYVLLQSSIVNNNALNEPWNPRPC